MPELVEYPELERDAGRLLKVGYPDAELDALDHMVREVYLRWASMAHQAGFRLDEEQAA